jgi:hypothetical protein
MKRITLAIFATLLTMASTTFAATSATGTNTVAPTLQVSATVQSAVQLTLSTGTNLAGTSCAITPGGGTDYQMSFGTVDGLAITPVTCGAKYPASGGSNAVYYTDYQVTPAFSGQAANSASGTITAYVSANSLPTSAAIVYDTAKNGTNPANATGFTAMGTTAGTAYTLANGPFTSGTAIHPFIGVAISSGAGTAGAGSATITYTLTVQ